MLVPGSKYLLAFPVTQHSRFYMFHRVLFHHVTKATTYVSLNMYSTQVAPYSIQILYIGEFCKPD